MNIKKIILLLFALNLSVFYISSKNDDILNLTVFFTNDTSGHPLKFTDNEQDGQGGLPARASLIKKLSESKNKNDLLILDSGNIISGRPESNLFDGETDIAGMNAIGYFASGIGYSELRLGLAGLKKLNSKADFFYICSNVLDNKNKEFCDRYVVKKIGNFMNPLRIGIFSVISEEVANGLPDDIRKQYIIVNPIESAKQIIKELKSEKNKADIIIALTYLGYYDDSSKISSKTLAESVSGIDIIIDGRSQLKFNEPVTINNTKICQAYKWGLFLGEINMKLVNKKIEEFTYKLNPVNYKENNKIIGEPLDDDKKTLSAVKNKMLNYDAIIKKNIAKISGVNIDPNYSKFKETEIGNLICDAILDYTKADVAIQNAGGIGTSIIQQGELNRNSLDEIIKYDNSIVTVNLTGDEIIKLLEFSIANQGKGTFLQVSGIKFTYSKSQNRITEAKINNNDVVRSNFYKVAINSWISNGGDGYKIFTQILGKIDLSILIREVVYNYLENKKDYTPYKDGRINIIE